MIVKMTGNLRTYVTSIEGKTHGSFLAGKTYYFSLCPFIVNMVDAQKGLVLEAFSTSIINVM